MSDLVRAESLRFFGASEEFVFEASLKHGAGVRRVDVTFPAEKIIKICDLLKEYDHDEWGHAFWHYENGRPVPCSTCVLVGKKVVQHKEGNCTLHGTSDDQPCYVAVNAIKADAGEAHDYPGVNAFKKTDNLDDFFTSDCARGCGCWMGSSRSGGPEGADPFGKCPKVGAAKP